MYNDTITLFNKYEDVTGITWYPTVLNGVNLTLDKAAIIAKYGAESKDNAILNVRHQTVDGIRIVGNKPYLPPKEWRKQKEDLRSKTLTFSDGQAFDFFYFGDWGSETPVSDDSYGVNGFYDYMNRNYDYVFAITSVGGAYKVIPHFEIMGK